MRTCLVVDDSSVIRKVARRILEGLDFQILEAEDGEKALEACKRGLPDAVLLDWNMPVMDGFEFMGHLRRMPGGDQPKVVFCTTENNVAHIAQALEICQQRLPDAVLLDWNMPVMDGFEFMGHMRRLPGGDQPKVVFCTTENNVAHIAQALSGGANEYIMKPFDKDIIADKFAEVGLIPAGQDMA